MDLYEQLRAAGIETDNHESDLCFPVTPESTAILKEQPEWRRESVTTFHSQVDGRLWYDVPFGFTPFWDKVQERARRANT